MTRAALLPFTGDGLLLKTWLSCFEKWKDEIDHLYICLNGKISKECRDYIGNILLYHSLPEGKITLLQEDHHIDHGPAINKLLDLCKEDLIMLIEDDAFVFQKGQVDKCFKLIESGTVDIVASERGCTTDEIIRVTGRKFGCELPAFWPNFFFCKRTDLLKTDRHFQGKTWYKGDYIKELDHVLEDNIAPADTFVWASIQLRSLGLKVHLENQYHSYIEDIQDFTQIKGIFDRKCPWVHLGSLSGWQNVLFSANLQFRLGEVEEWERRTSAWLMFWEDAQEDLPEDMQEFSRQYKAGIDRLILEYTLSPTRVKLRTELYRQLINPELHAKRERNKL